MTDTQKLINHLDSLYPEWVYSHQLRGIDTEFGFIGSQGDKRARELAPGEGKNQTFRYFGKYNDVKYEIEGDKVKDRRGSWERMYRLRIVNDDLKLRYLQAIEILKKNLSFENAHILKEINSIKGCRYENVRESKMKSVIEKVERLSHPQTQPAKKDGKPLTL